YLTYLLIALSALAEWTGLKLDGVESLPKWPLILAKCADYCLTPMAGGALIGQMKIRNRWSKVLMTLLAVNAVFQVVSCFGGWVVRIDEHNRYSHGPLYGIYAGIYLTVIALIIVEFILYGKAFHKQNRASLYAIMALVIGGIAVQEFLGSEYRTSYLVLTIGAILLFIHYSEFFQMASDDKMREQEILISTDSLTGMLNRYAYAKVLESYDEDGRIPSDLCAFSIDINGLKRANDTLGHAVGDELICGAAECIKRVFHKKGRCFRTGGDEFIVLANLEKEKAEEALARLRAESTAWVGEGIDELHLAAGYASAKDHPGTTAEKLVIEADRAMYSEKNEFYSSCGFDRRKH
ncbi:MAG: GGDEF domain-containing protein, partial [Clostridia bacterium]|nr:GGDEF domain-containing protein [Clostridia bacterium]